MVFLRFAVLLTAVTAMLARPANAQTTVTVDVGFNNGGTLAFRDQASGSTSSAGNPAITRIHEGDTVQFVWQGTPPHNVNPYDPANHTAPYQAPFASNTITTASTWNPSTRSSSYRCTLHSATMTGQIFVYEVARQFRVAAPASVAPGAQFDVTVTALGMGNTPDALYRGTIRFSSSDPDPNIVLPPDYTFTAADNGTHTFSGVVLRTQTTAATITATATAGGLTGQTTVSVGTRPKPPENIRIEP